MTDLRKAAQQALEALESGLAFDTHSVVLQNLRTALAMHQVSEFAQQQQQAEPVAWMELLREARDNCKASIVEEGISASRKEYRIDLEARLTAAMNTTPPQRKWVGLTDEEIHNLDPFPHKLFDQERLDFARAIEAAHGIGENK